MSLDVYLTIKETRITLPTIYIREDGQVKSISRTEWDERYPGREPVMADLHETNEAYSANITHNLARMAGEAGIYDALWRPEEIGITKAAQLKEPLYRGLKLLESDPDRFRQFNPSSGWGNYELLVGFVLNYLAACEEYPDADVSVWR